MKPRSDIYSAPIDFLVGNSPDHPVMFFFPAALQAQARVFLNGFPGLVTYAVKANASETVLQNLAQAGIGGFDVASPREMDMVRRAVPGAVMHYNNPVRSGDEIAQAVDHGVQSFSVDDPGEYDKLARQLSGVKAEISVRLGLGIGGGAYDFGSKFGAAPDLAVDLLRAAADAGFRPAMTFHPGTQCRDAGAWVDYIAACAEVADTAGVRLQRLNVGGGFPADRGTGHPGGLGAIFAAIGAAVHASFGPDAPELLCEPGRAMVSSAFSLATRVKSRRGRALYLNDGIYGALGEAVQIGAPGMIEVLRLGHSADPEGHQAFTIFGPTCDSLDCLPGTVDLPSDVAEGDYLLIGGLGAYGQAMATGFNGYGQAEVVTIG
jgi:ornithine decarboxylase